MDWTRLYLTVEGHSERRFAQDILVPHFARFSIDLRARLVVTNRKLGRRGGILNFANIFEDIQRLLREDASPRARFSTMIDLYALPREFPGWERADKFKQPIERVTALESALGEKIADRRFIPYIQLHEFEALLYCDLAELERRLSGSTYGIRALRAEVAGFAPEDINEGVATAPSKRIINHVPAYASQKLRVGAGAAGAIGLGRLRAYCPHFNGWIGGLEALSPVR